MMHLRRILQTRCHLIALRCVLARDDVRRDIRQRLQKIVEDIEKDNWNAVYKNKSSIVKRLLYLTMMKYFA